MTIKVNKYIKNGDLYAEVSTSKLTAEDTSLFEKWGEPTIDLGGVIPMDAGDFTIPNKFRKIYSDSPFIFFRSNTADGIQECDGWGTTIVSRITTAMEDLKALTETYTGETETIV